MEQKILLDLYCFQCSLQFEKRSIYDLHLSIIHNYQSRNQIVIKNEPEDAELLPDLSNIQPTQKEKQELIKNVVSIDKGKKLNNCKLCGKYFKAKQAMNIHFTSVHEGKKPFK